MKLAAAGVIAVALSPFLVAGGVAMVASSTTTPTASSLTCTVSDTGDTSAGIETLGFLQEQLDNATIVYSIALERGLGERAAVIGIATAMQESGLRNLGHLGPANDHDSLGLFQQRPSQGWGTPEQILDPAYATGKFFDKLAEIPGWETMPLTVAAQTVQRSAYPDAYAKHETIATLAVDLLAGAIDCAPVVTPGGWTHPLPGTPVGSGYRTPERPGHDAVDFAAPKGTPILAAGAGTVVTALCNASYDGTPYSCDIDGSPNILGCGWYVEILHPDQTLTRYCHLQNRPLVAVGDTVTAGQTIGHIGSSGNSSGPHLHFETHTAYPAHSGNAVHPAEYLRQRGVKVLHSAVGAAQLIGPFAGSSCCATQRPRPVWESLASSWPCRPS